MSYSIKISKMKYNTLVKTSIYAVAIALFFLNSCASDNTTEIPKPMSCDSTNVSFSMIIVPILEQSCYSGCHDGTSPSSGISLDSYESVKAKVEDERLLGSVLRQTGFVAMPLNLPALSKCKTSQIKNWIEDGAMDN